MTDNEKASIYIKIIIWYFNLDMSERIDTYLNKCGMLIDYVNDDALKI